MSVLHLVELRFEALLLYYLELKGQYLSNTQLCMMINREQRIWRSRAHVQLYLLWTM